MGVVYFIIITLALFIIIRNFITQPFIVRGLSMYPTFSSGDFVYTDRLSYRLSSGPSRSDVIIFQHPRDSIRLIKRVIGLPNETIIIDKDGSISVSSDEADLFRLDEPYVNSLAASSNKRTFVLDEDEYFVLGDNRLESMDSRDWGPLKKDLIIGRVVFRLFPLKNIDILPGEYNMKS